MIVTHEREKLLNAIIFFAENTMNYGKTKMFKLLYFLDFEHFKETGRSVTGLNYFAWKMGPVPRDLFEEMESPRPDMDQKLFFSDVQTARGTMTTISPRVNFDPSFFSRRELRLMRSLAAEYMEAKADDMVEATHLENLPWHRVYEVEKRIKELIPYEYAIRKQEEDDLKEIVAERESLISYFQK